MEPATAEDIVYRYVQNKSKDFRIRFQQAAGIIAPWNLTPDGLAEQMKFNMRLQAALARVKYYMVPEPIPSDLQGQAAYWKQHYNTPLGAGTTEEYITNYTGG